jgi:hypothetical protein
VVLDRKTRRRGDHRELRLVDHVEERLVSEPAPRLARQADLLPERGAEGAEPVQDDRQPHPQTAEVARQLG